MTNKEFLIEVQKACHLDMPLCLSLMGSMQKIMAKAAVDQIPVVLPGLGMFTSHKHPEYIQENQATGAMTLYPPRISYRMTCDVVDDATSISVLLAQYASVPEIQANSFVNAFVSAINDHLMSGEEIEVPGIGWFQNIMTHHSEMRHVSYIPSDQMKELVNAPFSCFEPVVISEGTAPGKIHDNGAQEMISEDTPVVSKNELQPSSASDEKDSFEVIIEKEEEDELKKENVIVEESQHTFPEEEKKNAEPEYREVGVDRVVTKDETVSTMNQKVEDFENSHKSKKEKSSTNWSLYISLVVILAACGFVVWLMFGDSSGIWEGSEPQEAVVVNYNTDPFERDNLNKEEVSLNDSLITSEDLETINEDSDNAEIANAEESKSDRIENTTKEEKNDVLKIDKKVDSIVKDSKSSDPVSNNSANKDYHRMAGPDGNPVTVTLKPGERLTLVALEHFGDKAFWPYIFDANSDKLKAPNLVQAGMTLYLPDPSYYGIDAKDEKSLQKAKSRGAQLLK